MKPTLTAAFRAAARDAGDTHGLVYCEEPGRQTFRGYAALDLRARTVADALDKAGYAAGDAVVIGLPQCLSWVEAAYGVLYAGMTVVPVAITGSDSPERAAEKIARIALAADAAIVITDASLSPALSVALRPDGATATMLFADLVSAGDPDTWTEPDISPDSRALLLFTSGSTGNPKGVIATHRSLVVEADLASAALGFSERTVFVGWLPLYHSMGLTLQWLTPAAIGAHVVLTSPEQFQRRPMFWLQMLSDFGATASAASNFAFELCTKFATDEQVASLDLSRVEVVVSAGEPVRSEAVAAFADRFASTGMRSAAVTPAIGMTETMLYCGKPLTDDLAPRRFDETAREAGRLVAADGPGSRELTSCGRPFPGVSVRIVDTETLEVLPDGRVGEVWVSSPAMSLGYLGRDDLTAEAFGHTLPGDGHAYLRTGDLGALIDGELFVTGRLKDVIIIRGRNIYPQDIEADTSRVCRHLGLSAAFELNDNSSAVGILIEFDLEAVSDGHRSLAELASDVRTELTQRFSIPSLAVGLVSEGSLPRTPTGKIQRKPTRVALEAGRIRLTHSIGFPTPVGL